MVSVSDAVSVYVVVPAGTVAATVSLSVSASKVTPSGRPPSAVAPAAPADGLSFSAWLIGPLPPLAGLNVTVPCWPASIVWLTSVCGNVGDTSDSHGSMPGEAPGSQTTTTKNAVAVMVTLTVISRGLVT